jgi:hypothetical protein
MGCFRLKGAALIGVAMGSVACSSTEFTSARDAGRGGEDAAVADADSGGGENDAGNSDAGRSDSEAEAAAPRQITLEVATDTDDATWIGGSDERLRYSSEHPYIEVGSDAEFGRAGLRFALPIARGSVIHSATLRVRRVDGPAAESETMLVQVWDSGDIDAFDAEHTHLPRDHAPGGLWPVTVSGFQAGTNGSMLETPDLSELVQHVIDRSDWSEGNAIGFHLSPDTIQTWLGLGDSSTGNRASLQIRFTPAR